MASYLCFSKLKLERNLAKVNQHTILFITFFLANSCLSTLDIKRIVCPISHYLTILFIHESLLQKEDLTPSHDSFWECREWLPQKEDLTPSHDSFYSWVTPSERRSHTISQFFLYMSHSPKKKISHHLTILFENVESDSLRKKISHHLTILFIHEWLLQKEDLTPSHDSFYTWVSPPKRRSYTISRFFVYMSDSLR